MKVLVTGATGFVGRALLGEFARRGFETIAAGGPNSDDVQYSIDVGDQAAVESLSGLRAVDAVVHAAGIAHRFGKTADGEFQRVNVDGTRNVAMLAARLGAKHFILISSTLVYGRRTHGNAIAEDSHCRPFDAYGRSKLDSEAAAREVCEGAGIDLTILRPAPIVGEGSKGNFARLIRAIDRGRFLWVGRGQNLKSIVYVGDVGTAIATVIEKGGEGIQIFNVSAMPAKMEDVVDTIAAKLDRKISSIHLPTGPVRLVAKIHPGLSRTLDTWLGNDVYANEALQHAYGFTPKTSLDTAIGREVEYYLKHKC